jgi:hypothetical protein
MHFFFSSFNFSSHGRALLKWLELRQQATLRDQNPSSKAPILTRSSCTTPQEQNLVVDWNTTAAANEAS